MLNTGREFIRYAPWTMLFPGGALFLAVMAVNLVGDRLSQMLDPKQRGAADGSEGVAGRVPGNTGCPAVHSGLIWSRNPARARAFAERVPNKHGIVAGQPPRAA